MLRSFYINILVIFCTLITFKEFFYKLLIRFRINERYTPFIDLYNDVFKENKTIRANDLKKIYSFKYMNKKEQKITEKLCEIINLKISSNEYNQYIDLFLNEIEKHKTKLSVLWFLDIETLSMCGGFYVLAWDIRQLLETKLIEKYENKQKVHFYDTRRLFLCYLYKGDLTKAEDVIKKASYTWKQRHDGYWQYMLAMTKAKNLADIPSLLKMENNKNDDKYHNIIFEKNIAVFGPSSNVLDVEQIKKDYDVKIIMTYRGVEHLSEVLKKCGIDVSYYSVWMGIKYTEPIIQSFLYDLKMVVFKQINNDNQKDMIQQGRSRMRSKRDNCLLMQGHDYLIPLIIMDLLHFAPSSIKLFNLNLFLPHKSSAYREGYLDLNNVPFGFDKGNNQLNPSNFAIHNIISYYELLKFWYTRGFFEADDELSEILSFDTKEYLRLMEQYY
jgi:hypothetical protein